MFPLVEFPEIVQHYAPCFETVFSADAFIEFKRYISGLIVSENKTVEGINRLFVVESRNQSSLNRLLTASPFALEDLNQSRLDVLEHLPGTRIKPKGVFSLDNTLLMHYGEDFEQIAKLFDHVTGTYVWAHDLVTLHYSDDDTDYPALFQLWKPVDLAQLEQGLRAAHVPLKSSKEVLKESDPAKWRGYLLGVWQRRQKSHPEIRELYDSKLSIAQQLLQQWVTAHPDQKLPVTFDNWFTQPAFCRFLDQSLKLPYVGTLAGSDKVNLKTGQTTLDDFAAHLKQEHLDAVQHGGKPVFQRITIVYKGEAEHYFSYCNTHRTLRVTLVNNAWSSTIVSPTCRTRRPFSSATVWSGRRPASRAFDAIAGPLKSITRKARRKGWISINCGTLVPSNVMSLWSPWCTAYCVRLNTTLTFANGFNVNSK